MNHFQNANAGVSIVLVIVSFFMAFMGEDLTAGVVLFFGFIVLLMLVSVFAAVGLMNRAKRKNEDKAKHTEYTIGADGELVPLEGLEDDYDFAQRNTR